MWRTRQVTTTTHKKNTIQIFHGVAAELSTVIKRRIGSASRPSAAGVPVRYKQTVKMLTRDRTTKKREANRRKTI